MLADSQPLYPAKKFYQKSTQTSLAKIQKPKSTEPAEESKTPSVESNLRFNIGGSIDRYSERLQAKELEQ